MFSLQRITWQVEKPTVTKLEKGEICISGRLRDPLYEYPACYNYYPGKRLLFLRRNFGGCPPQMRTDAYHVEQEDEKEFRLFQLEGCVTIQVEMVEEL